MAFFKKKKPANAGQVHDRAARIVADYKLITAVFKDHAHISIKEVFGAPPEKYHFLYRIDGLEKARNSIEVKGEHVVEVVLPPTYPDVAPACTRVTPLFHPNVSDTTIDVGKFWKTGESLADLIVVIGEMICLQKYDTQNPLSSEAAKWADRNRSMLPLCKDNLQYAPPAAEPDEPPATTVAILAQDAEKTPPPEDARKTEGIYIDNGVDQISIDGETVSTPPRELEMRETAVLQEEPITDETVSDATDAAKPEPAPQTSSQTFVPGQMSNAEPEPSESISPGLETADPERPRQPELPKKIPSDVPAAKPDTVPTVSQAPDIAKSESPVQESPKSEIPQDSQALPLETKPKVPGSAPSAPQSSLQIQKKPSVYVTSARPETPRDIPMSANEDTMPGMAAASVPPSQKETETSMPVVSRDRARNVRAVDSDETSQEEPISCSTCSYFNPSSANFCSNCGAKIKRQSVRSDLSLSKVMLLSALTSIPVAILSVAITLLVVNQIKPAVRIVEVPAPAVVAAAPAVVPAPAPAPVAAVQEAPQPKPQPGVASTSAPKASKSAALSADQKRERIEECLKLAQTYVNLGSLDEAMNKYMYVLKLDPKNDDALDGLRTVRDAKDKAAADSAKPKR
jgi:ubiquitin-protein ligase